MRCDGYLSPTTGNNKRQRQQSASPACNRLTATFAPPFQITAYAIPFRIPGSQKDRQMLHYFCVQASHDLSGYLSSEFWSRVVLQCSHTESVIRHALVALSSIHLDFVTHESPHGQQSCEGGHNVETSLQYSRAVRQLRKHLSSTAQPSTKVALICCILFYCFESTYGDYDSAREHLRCGLIILQTAKVNRTKDKPSSDSVQPHDDLEQLSQILSRLDLQATLFDDTRTPFLELTSAEERFGVAPVVPHLAFSDLAEAQATLDKLQNQLFNFLTRNNRYKFVSAEDLPDFIVGEKCELEKQFRRWSVALDGFWELQTQPEAVKQRPRHSEHNIMTRQGTSILKLHHRIARMFLSASFPEDSSVFGASPNPDAEFILGLAEFLIQSNRKSQSNAASGSSIPSRSFSSEMGIVAPLFLLAMKCHDTHICEKAVSLLAASNRREGLIDAQMVLGIVQRVAMLKRREEVTPLVAEAAKRSPAASTEEMPLEIWGADAIEGTNGGLLGIAKMLDVPC
jgi:hypothetical protein